MLIEKDKMLLKNEEIAKKFNQYFEYITDVKRISFLITDLYEFSCEKAYEGQDDFDKT